MITNHSLMTLNKRDWHCTKKIIKVTQVEGKPVTMWNLKIKADMHKGIEIFLEE